MKKDCELHYGVTVLDGLKKLKKESVQTVVTSPPYWGLRHYGTAPQVWGGKKKCEHRWEEAIKKPTGGKNHPDRPTKAHEYIFLLTKSEKYYYDIDAVREPCVYPEGPNSPESIKSPYWQGFSRKRFPCGWDSGPGSHKDLLGNYGKKRKKFDKSQGGSGSGFDGHSGTKKSNGDPINHPLGRNKRTVWEIATQPYSDAHFATFPEEIPKTCILAGSRPGDIILDPFSGSGTTGVVAIGLGRKYIGIDLSEEYLQLAKNRIGLFALC